MSVEILNREDMHYGGFAGLREHRLVMGRKIFGYHAEPATWDGIGNFVYLADAKFNPHGQTNMHPHREIDVISIMVDGSIKHEGSLEHGEQVFAGDIQVQRAGGEGFSHNEINPDDKQNRMLQLWVLPETTGEPASYKLYRNPENSVTRIYGGDNEKINPFLSRTIIDVVQLKAGETHILTNDSLTYVYTGEGVINDKSVIDGNLIKTTGDEIKALSNMSFFSVYLLK